MTYERSPLPYRPVEERVHDWGEVHAVVSEAGGLLGGARGLLGGVLSRELLGTAR